MTATERDPAPMLNVPLYLRLARLRAFLWRFRTLQLADKLFAKVPRPCVLERPFFGYRLFVDVSRSNAQRLLYLEGERFVAERFLLRRLLRPGFKVADVGANIGYYMLYLAHLLGQGGSISCFEPEPENLLELERNKERNRLANVRVFPIAVGDSDGEVSLHPGINGRVADDGSGSLIVPIRRLDSVLSEPIDLLKMDVEGYEGHVLAGAEKLIREQRPILFIEVHPAFLASPTSVAGIFELVAAYYPHIAAYLLTSRCRRPHEKLASRYLRGSGVSRVQDLESFLIACRDGSETEPFWLVCCIRPISA